MPRQENAPRKLAHALKSRETLPKPDLILRSPSPLLKSLFATARLDFDRYIHRLADEVAEEANIHPEEGSRPRLGYLE